MPKLADRVRAVGFDLDGTLVDTAPDLAAAANAMLEAQGCTPLAEARIASWIGNGIERLVERALEAAAGRPPTSGETMAATTAVRSAYGERLFDRSRVYAGVVEGLDALATAGFPLCCITNKPGDFALPLLEAAGLMRYFGFALSPGPSVAPKPAPDLLVDACARLGIAPDEFLYVGDSRVDVAAAKASGCPVALVGYGYGHGVAGAGEAPDFRIGALQDLLALLELPSARTLA